MSRQVRLAIAVGGGCVVVAVAAALAVDSRLDRQIVARTGMLVLSLLCALVLAARQRRSTRLIGWTGIALWGLIAPLVLTATASPPEADFAIAVHEDAKAAATRQAQSVITIADVTAAAKARGGAVGTLPTAGNPVEGANTFPLVLRPDPSLGRPRICIAIEHGTEARIRRC
jgi:hypothetical protein